MSPITQAARERLMVYLHDHQVPNEPAPPHPSMIGRLIDNLIAAVRSERPEDHPF